MAELQTIVETFSAQLSSLIQAQALAQARSVVAAALGGGSVAKRRGRPPKTLQVVTISSAAAKRRKKAPLQLCPVPGCKNPAAPAFGMVCGKHRDVAKSKIKKYHEARKARKAA